MTLSSIRWDMVLGGFGLFLFGIEFMGGGLKSIAGDKMRDYIEKYTSTPLKAILIGIVLTVLMQSSSASTAITISFVRAGLMTLNQAAGIVFGANIGTTFTTLLISLNLDQYTLYIVAVGALLLSFSKKKKVKYVGSIIFGFGMLFFGLSLMGDALAEIKELPQFEAVAISMSNNPLLSLGAGIILTALVQSSAATIAIIQKLYQAGAIDIYAAIPFMFGANIGTTITGILAALGGSLGARRTAGLHTLFNILRSIIGMLILTPYTHFILQLADKFNLSPMMQIAFANIIFSTLATICFTPFMQKMVKIVSKIIPGSEKERPDVNIDNLDEDISNYLPAAAIHSAEIAISQMAKVVRDDIVDTKDYLNKPGTKEDQEYLNQSEALINRMDKKITEYLIRISQHTSSMSEHDNDKIRLDLEIVKNLERIGDLATNLVEFFQMVFDDSGQFTEYAYSEINKMFDTLIEMFDKCIVVYETSDNDTYMELLDLEDKLDSMEFKFRNNHFDRLSNNACGSAIAASVYADILGNLERMGDHCRNIGRSTVSDMPLGNHVDF
ncbi:MAG: Na/Pi cotransporter family protein [Erysipelotrichaceae bacterium]|nr:Na/Pi cotransporter family protein [Erysipelotrichaceae bacterium]